MLAYALVLWYSENMAYNYKSLYEKNAKFYNQSPTAKQMLELSDILLTWLFFIAYGAIWIPILTAEIFSPIEGLKALLPLFGCIPLVTAARLMIDRARPYAEDGAGIQPVLNKRNTQRNSCPSRHLACAAVISMICLYFSTIGGAFLLQATIALAYTRFAAGFHYPSDLIAGTALGIACGLPLFLL